MSKPKNKKKVNNKSKMNVSTHFSNRTEETTNISEKMFRTLIHKVRDLTNTTNQIEAFQITIFDKLGEITWSIPPENQKAFADICVQLFKAKQFKSLDEACLLAGKSIPVDHAGEILFENAVHFCISIGMYPHEQNLSIILENAIQITMAPKTWFLRLRNFLSELHLTIDT